MNIKKRFLALMLVVVLISGMCLGADAANNILTYHTLDSIDEDLNIFKTIANGRISAVKEDNDWYYQFTRSGYTTVRIKVSAFMTSPKNTYLKTDNQALNKSLAQSSNENYDRVCYYNLMTSKKGVNYTTYSTSMYRLRLEVGGASDEFTTKCELTHGVKFTYTTKVPINGKYYDAGLPERPSYNFNRYITPSTATQYLAALKRSSSVGKITPTMTVAVTNTGSNNLYLSRYTVNGKGNASSSVSSVKGLIDVVYSTITLGKSVVTAVVTPNFFTVAGAFKTLANIDMGKLTKVSNQSNQYNTGKEIALSINKRYVYKTAYTSPIKLSNSGDWTQVVTKCPASIKNATFNVTFSFS